MIYSKDKDFKYIILEYTLTLLINSIQSFRVLNLQLFPKNASLDVIDVVITSCPDNVTEF